MSVAKVLYVCPLSKACLLLYQEQILSHILLVQSFIIVVLFDGQLVMAKIPFFLPEFVYIATKFYGFSSHSLSKIANTKLCYSLDKTI